MAISTLLIFLSLPSFSFAQKSQRLDSLYRAQNQIEKDIRFLTKARDSTRHRKESSLAELQLMHKQVILREQMLKGMAMQVKELDKEIANAEVTIKALEEEIVQVKQNYARLVIATYKALNNKSGAFYVFSSKSLTQSYHRARYFQAISRVRQSQMNLIKRTKAFLAKKKIEMEQRKAEKQKVAVREKLEREKLIVLKEEQKTLYKKLKADEAKFDKDLSNTKKQLIALKNAIKKEIERLASLATKDKTDAELDVINKLSTTFVSNKGKFPWPMPMPNATVTRKFGRQSLPGGIVVDLQGIDITTLPQQKVRAVYGGKVEQIMPVMGQGKMLIVSHGKYYTVYANLAAVDVKVGDQVNTLQSVGTARTDPGTGETKIHFQLYKERTPQNPEHWLVKKG